MRVVRGGCAPDTTAATVWESLQSRLDYDGDCEIYLMAIDS